MGLYLAEQIARKALRTALLDDRSEPLNKKVPVCIIIKYLFSSNSSDTNMMQCARGVYACFAGHMVFVSAKQNNSNWIFNVRPLSALKCP